MGIIPEYGDEELMREHEEEVEHQAGSQLPPWEDIGEAEVVEHELSDKETQHQTSGDPGSLPGPADADSKHEDFDESPDGWALELAGHVDEDADSETSPS